MSYLTIKEQAIAEFEEKKSVFIGHVKRVYSEEEARRFISEIKGSHKEARHNIYSYVIGQNMGIQRYSDDGEPQGTAGIPVLELIKKNGLTDIVVVVTRYFGGILLGTGGLARAYSKAASLAIKEGGTVEKVKGLEVNIVIDYDLLGKVQYICNQNLWHIEDTEYTDVVKIKLFCEVSNYNNFEKEITEATSGKAEFYKEEEKYYFKCENRLILE